MRALRSKPQMIRVTRKPGSVHDGLLTIDGQTLPCQLGRTGTTHVKREGDGATPCAPMRLISLWYRADRIRRPPGWFGHTAVPILPDDGWCDDVNDSRYNRPVTLPIRASHEVLSRDDHLYDIVGVLDWNLYPRSLARGSAIFLHCARPDAGPTAGCIALKLDDLRLLLRKLQPDAVFAVI